jgi:phosphatidylglycerophosphate synthase
MWGKLKTVTQMIAISLAFLDVNAFGDVFFKELTVPAFILNLIVTILMIICTIATIFSGFEYLKGGKDILKDTK